MKKFSLLSKLKNLVAALLFTYAFHPALLSQISSGAITNYPETAPPPYFTFGDGSHDVTVWWSVANPNLSGYFYGADAFFGNRDTAVGVAIGITSIDQITDASAYSLTLGTALLAEGQFLILRDQSSGYYGVVRVDDIFPYANAVSFPLAGMNATWWFQANGGGNFSPSAVPEPANAAIICAVVSLMAVGAVRKRLNRR